LVPKNPPLLLELLTEPIDAGDSVLRLVSSSLGGSDGILEARKRAEINKSAFSVLERAEASQLFA
jgi:hypothetical protein